jgi:hypothetical protein
LKGPFVTGLFFILVALLALVVARWVEVLAFPPVEIFDPLTQP